MQAQKERLLSTALPNHLTFIQVHPSEATRRAARRYWREPTLRCGATSARKSNTFKNKGLHYSLNHVTEIAILLRDPDDSPKSEPLAYRATHRRLTPGTSHL
ncbi:hypothetical protein NK8_42380 [Caballeronia sp. NK8]|nr:hypothetical protein NK8_42380 [Caballeronia sp. NK8]